MTSASASIWFLKRYIPRMIKKVCPQVVKSSGLQSMDSAVLIRYKRHFLLPVQWFQRFQYSRGFLIRFQFILSCKVHVLQLQESDPHCRLLFIASVSNHKAKVHYQNSCCSRGLSPYTSKTITVLGKHAVGKRLQNPVRFLKFIFLIVISLIGLHFYFSVSKGTAYSAHHRLPCHILYITTTDLYQVCATHRSTAIDGSLDL